ncbi:MAG: ferredoxin [Saprospiraceae bacterium]|nr:ferredoxin [Saprospiraceae bacterium]
MIEQDTARDQTVDSPSSEFIPELEDVAAADQDRIEAYRKTLKEYFVREEKTDEPSPDVLPVLLAPHLRSGDPAIPYPVVFDQVTHTVATLRQVLEDDFAAAFEGGEAEILAQHLQQVESGIRDHLTEHQDAADLASVTSQVLDTLCASDAQDEVLLEQANRFRTHMQQRQALVIRFSSRIIFQLLNPHLERQHARHAQFLKILKQRITGLRELIDLQREDPDGQEPDRHFDFAGNLMSFDKIAEIAAAGASSHLPELRLKRVIACLQTLEQAHDSYQKTQGMVFVQARLAEQFKLTDSLDNATLQITSGKPCEELRSYYQEEMTEFVRVIAAVRLAQLEIDQKYVEDLHTPYFDGFDFSYLREDEMQYFRTVIAVEDAQQLAGQPEDMLALISDRALVKVVALNTLDQLTAGPNYATGDEGYLELAALAIFRRNAYVFQGGADTPALLNEALGAGLDLPAPALWNILCPASRSSGADFVCLKAAVESRYFPRLNYDMRSGERFGSHFEISQTPQPEKLFCCGSLEIKTADGRQEQAYALTMADFLLLQPGRAQDLHLVPAWYADEDLVLLAEHLRQPREKVRGKVPYIWVVDAQDRLQRLVVPVSWLLRCRARLDYWQFLQEVAGVNSYHVQRAIEEARAAWEAGKDAEISALKANLDSEVERIRQEEVGLAIRRMLHALLDPETSVEALAAQALTSVVPTEQEDTATEQESGESESAPDASPAAVVRADAWVESDQCTSCSDCIDALPSVFRYNEDKQAFVHNPTGGPYARIVALAEKCPARCIHPGLPHDPDEPGLEKLVKRAGKFN